MTKTAKDLERNPFFLGKDKVDAPVTKAMGHLTATEGPLLEEMARVNSPEMVKAMTVGYILSEMYGSKYIKGRMNQILRVSIADHGQGRRDIIDVVDAGGTLPEGYYSGQSKKHSFQIIEDD